MLVDEGLIKNKAMFMKKFDEKVREPNEENCENGSRSENYDVLICFSVMLCLLYAVLIMFVNHN